MRGGSLKHTIYKYLRSRLGVKVNLGEIEKLAQSIVTKLRPETGERAN
jgi:hypothetical protein